MNREFEKYMRLIPLLEEKQPGCIDDQTKAKLEQVVEDKVGAGVKKTNDQSKIQSQGTDQKVAGDEAISKDKPVPTK
ncbi:hypothetical protein TWF694_008967 [Orbilia ellipsospora]|uniref:Uncharacterized protein n=1 Tax=Orbilia ellipsospora TaxID=2528407 RepID=A0AAV9XEQ2_9PEZI